VLREQPGETRGARFCTRMSRDLSAEDGDFSDSPLARSPLCKQAPLPLCVSSSDLSAEDRDFSDSPFAQSPLCKRTPPIPLSVGSLSFADAVDCPVEIPA